MIYFLLIAMIFILLNSCATPENAKDPENKAEEEARDLGGKTFVVVPQWIAIYFADEGTTIEGDARNKRYREIEQNYNCKIEVTEDPNVTQTIFAQAATGNIEYDMVYTLSYYGRDMFLDNILADFRDLEAINLEDENKWDIKIQKDFLTLPGGEVIGASRAVCNYWPVMHQYEGALYCNNTLLKRSGAISPFEMLEKREWTFDNFQKWLPTIATVTSEDKIYALSTTYESFTTAAIYANGGKKYYKDDNNIYSFGFSRPEAINAIDWSASIFAMKDCVALRSKAEFVRNQAVLACTGSYEATENYRPEQILNVIDDITWLYFPYGPDAEYGTTYSSNMSYTTSTFITLTDYEQDAAFVFNKMTEPFDDFGPDGYLFGHAKRNLFHYAKEGFDVWYDNYSNCNFESLSVIYSEIANGPINSKINSALGSAASGKKSPAEAIGAITESIQTEINKIVNNAS